MTRTLVEEDDPSIINSDWEKMALVEWNALQVARQITQVPSVPKEQVETGLLALLKYAKRQVQLIEQLIFNPER